MLMFNVNVKKTQQSSLTKITSKIRFICISQHIEAVHVSISTKNYIRGGKNQESSIKRQMEEEREGGKGKMFGSD